MFAQFTRRRLIHPMIFSAIFAAVLVFGGWRSSPRGVRAATPARIASAPAGTTYNVSTVAQLLNAVNLVNAGPGGDTIVLAAGTYVVPTTLFIFRDVTIQGDASASSIVDGGSAQIILQTFSASISVQNLTFQNAADTAIVSDSPASSRPTASPSLGIDSASMEATAVAAASSRIRPSQTTAQPGLESVAPRSRLPT